CSHSHKSDRCAENVTHDSRCKNCAKEGGLSAARWRYRHRKISINNIAM
ncbi:unnamed protein product, partial [Amoebophrya sp. A120]